VIVLGIETSCDETAAAVVADGCRVLSNVVRSQVDMHRPHGGVVPEIASRAHTECLPSVIESAVREAGVAWSAVDAVAATFGPGLASSLLVGLSTAKGLALRLSKPLCAVNHLQAHVLSPFLSPAAPALAETVPFLALVVSGGHTCLVRCENARRIVLLGETIDDAAGEAFDKGANLLGLGYPGGPAIDRAAREGNARAVRFPRGRVGSVRGAATHLDLRLCFSYSGVKTALLYHLKAHPVAAGEAAFSDVVASYQEAILDTLVARCERAMDGVRTLAVGGGVSLNRRLRAMLTALAQRRGVQLLLAELAYCADNAAMVAGLAGAGGGRWDAAAWESDVEPSLPIEQV
jgi:N6-L-threonylcarbamoyladenine synthase